MLSNLHFSHFCQSLCLFFVLPTKNICKESHSRGVISFENSIFFNRSVDSVASLKLSFLLQDESVFLITCCENDSMTLAVSEISYCLVTTTFSLKLIL